MNQIFVELSEFKDEVIAKIKSLFECELSSINNAEIVISDSANTFTDSNNEAVKFFITPVSGIIIDKYYDILEQYKINGCFFPSEHMPQIISEECFRVSNKFISRGLENFFDKNWPIYFDHLYSTNKIGKKIDNIIYFCDEAENENQLRNLLTSQLMLTGFFIKDVNLENIEIEFAKDNNKLMFSSAISTLEGDETKILSILKSNRTLARNLLEDANHVSITFSPERIKILSCIYPGNKLSLGFNVYSSKSKEENIHEQIELDKNGGLNYINFSNVEGLIKQTHDLDEAKSLETKNKKYIKSTDNTESEKMNLSHDKETTNIIKENNDLQNQMNMILKSNSDEKVKLEEIEKLQSKQGILLQRFAAITRNIDILKNENILLKDKLNDEILKNRKIENLSDKNAVVVDQISKDLGRLSQNKRELEKNTETLRELNLSKNEEMKTILNNLKISEAEKSNLESALTSFEKKVLLIKDKERDTMEKSFRNAREVEDARKTISSLDQKIKRDENLIHKLENQIKEIESSGTRNIQIERELRAELQNAAQESKNKDREINKIKEEYELLKQKESEKSNANKAGSLRGSKSPEELEQMLRKAEVRAISSEGKVKTLEATLEKLEAKEKRLKAETSEFTTELTKKDMQTDKLKKDLTRLKTELANLQIENDHLKKTLSTQNQGEANNKKVDDIKKEFAAKDRKLEMENQKLNALVKNIKKTNESAERQLGALRDTVNELTRKYTAELNAGKKKDLKIKELERK